MIYSYGLTNSYVCDGNGNGDDEDDKPQIID